MIAFATEARPIEIPNHERHAAEPPARGDPASLA